jgi:hypothetical protein
VRRSPANESTPASGRYTPLMMFKMELLPAPFGPITAQIS